MAIQFDCTHCGKHLQAHEQKVGAVLSCPSCRGSVRVPAPASTGAGHARPVRVLAGHEGAVNAVGFSPDGRLLASGGNDGVVRVWEVAGCREVRRLTCQLGRDREKVPVHDVAFSPNGRYVMAGMGEWRFPTGLFGGVKKTVHNCTARLWEVATGEEQAKYDYPDPVECVAVAQAGNLAAVGVKGMKGVDIHVVDLLHAREVSTQSSGGKRTTRAAFSPCGGYLLHGAWPLTCVILSESGSSRPGRYFDLDSEFEGLAYSPCGRGFAALSRAGVSLWSLPGGKMTRAVPLGRAAGGYRVMTPRGLAFSADGRRILMTAYGQRPTDQRPVNVFVALDLNTLEPVSLAEFVQRADGMAGGVASSPDSRLAASGLEDGTVQLFSIPA